MDQRFAEDLSIDYPLTKVEKKKKKTNNVSQTNNPIPT